VNFVAFVTPCYEFAKVWDAATQALESFDLCCCVMVPGKLYRVCPKKPLSFHKWTELCHEVRREQPDMSKDDVFITVRKKMKTNQQPVAPIGSPLKSA
jgi:hypothetical protein